MAHAYTPGLKVTVKTKIVKERRLPLQGEVMVSKGDVVKGDMEGDLTATNGPNP